MTGERTAETEQAWRPKMVWRVAAIAGCPVGIAAAVGLLVSGGISPGTVILAAALALAGALAIPYAIRSQITLHGGELVIVNALRTYRVPVAEVAGGRCTGAGIVFRLTSGRLLTSAVAQGKAPVLAVVQQETYGDQIVKAIVSAAEAARGTAPAAPSGPARQ